MCPKGGSRMANSVVPDQTPTSRAVWSECTLSAQAFLFQYVGNYRWSPMMLCLVELQFIFLFQYVGNYNLSYFHTLECFRNINTKNKTVLSGFCLVVHLKQELSNKLFHLRGILFTNSQATNTSRHVYDHTVAYILSCGWSRSLKIWLCQVLLIIYRFTTLYNLGGVN